MKSSNLSMKAKTDKPHYLSPDTDKHFIAHHEVRHLLILYLDRSADA